MALDPEAAVAAIRAKTAIQPRVAIVLGSGLGRLADDVTGATRIPYADIPGWERSTRARALGRARRRHAGREERRGHEGRASITTRGTTWGPSAFPIRVFHAWGIDTIILTNACGGLDPAFKAGDLMLLADHINFMPANPLRGANDEALGRVPLWAFPQRDHRDVG